jgi:hypothetical protein
MRRLSLPFYIFTIQQWCECAFLNREFRVREITARDDFAMHYYSERRPEPSVYRLILLYVAGLLDVLSSRVGIGGRVLRKKPVLAQNIADNCQVRTRLSARRGRRYCQAVPAITYLAKSFRQVSRAAIWSFSTSSNVASSRLASAAS